MNVRLVIDRLVMDGVALSPRERTMLHKQLQESLALALREKAAAHIVPHGRRVRRESVTVELPGAVGGGLWGESLGASLAAHVWKGPPKHVMGSKGS